MDDVKLRQPLNIHRLVPVGFQVDPLTGEEWDLLECPTCGYLAQYQARPYKCRVLRLGEGMLTPEDAAEFAALGDTPEGHLAVMKRFARAPSHTYMGMPRQQEMQQIADLVGKGEEFKAEVEEAQVEGRPLLSLTFGGVDLSAWPDDPETQRDSTTI